MKRYIQIVTLVIGAILLLAVFLPNVVLNSTVFAKGDTKGSTIGGIEVMDLKDSTLESTLKAAITEWQATAVEISDRENTTKIDANQLTFDITAAIIQYDMMTKKPWYAFWQKDKVVHIPIPVTANDAVLDQIKAMPTWESDKTLNNVLMQASYLRSHEVEAVVSAAFMPSEERIGFQVADIPASVLGIPKVIASLNDVLFVPNEPVSFLTLLGEQTGAVNEEGLDFLASMLYSAVLQTDYELIERHSQQVLRSYLQQGIEADVNVALAKDLRFANMSEQSGKLKTTIEGNTLKIEIFAPKKDKDVSVRVSKNQIVKPRIVYRYAEDVNVGQERVEQEGQEGVRVEVYRSIVENGTTEEQLVSKDYYAPQNRIITRSSKEPVPVITPEQNASAGTADADLQIDLDGNGLPDAQNSATTTNNAPADDPDIVYGYYDKGGNFVQTSP